MTEDHDSASQNKITFSSYPYSNYGSQGYSNSGAGARNHIIQSSINQQGVSDGGYSSMINNFPPYGYGYGTGQPYISSNGYIYGNYNNLGYSTYGRSFGNYGIPDQITNGISSGSGSCPYCFGNKSGYKTRRSKRSNESLRRINSDKIHV
ncbi:hypothetical protein DICVIV_02507 [Dictyocaulus viviparus]|uniref:Uncharacterized protein n=1 Tax=Dictyocaulus viviparus TaxID=29172 RepID=A0A0D8Y5P7_DICVI|nr:hypothetical protein DICVIV_02507 [Dictyocaulus viviparus]